MPDYSKYARLRVPAGPEAPTVPADLQLLVDGFDTLLNLKATDEQDRNARYGDAPVGTLVSLTTRGELHWKAPEGWRVVSRKPFETTSALDPEDNWSPSSNYLYLLPSGGVRVYFGLVYQGPDLNVPSNGNITNQTVGSIDSTYAPIGVPAPLQAGAAGRMTGGFVDTNGRVTLAWVAPPGNITSGETLQLVGAWPL